MAILNKYKDTLDDFINNSNTESLDQPKSLDWLKPIDKETCNASRTQDASLSFLEKNCMDKDVLVTSLELAPKTQDCQVYKCCHIIPLVLKSERAKYGKSQKNRLDGKNKRDGENKRSERDGKSHRQNDNRIK